MDPIALAGEADGRSSGTVGDGIAKSGRSNETGQTGRGEFQSAVLSRRLAGDKPTLLLYHPMQPSSSLNLRRIPGRDCFQPVLFKISISSRLLRERLLTFRCARRPCSRRCPAPGETPAPSCPGYNDRSGAPAARTAESIRRSDSGRSAPVLDPDSALAAGLPVLAFPFASSIAPIM